MKHQENSSLNKGDSKYVNTLFGELKKTIEEPAFGETSMFYPFDSSSSEEEDASSDPLKRNLSQKFEASIHKKLGKYEGMQPSIIGSIVTTVIHLAGLCLSFLEGDKIRAVWITFYFVVQVAWIGLFLLMTRESYRKSKVFGVVSFLTKTMLHFLFILNLSYSTSLPIVAKLMLIRGSVLVPSTANLYPTINGIVEIASDLCIFLIVGADNHQNGNPISISLIIFALGGAFNLYYRLWNSSVIEKMADWLQLAMEKLVVNADLFSTLGGHPTFWQKSETPGLRRRPCFPPELTLTKTLSSPGKRRALKQSSQPIRIEGKIHAEEGLLSAEDRKIGESPTKRMSMTADEISSILKDVFFTQYSCFEAIVNDRLEKDPDIKFQNGCNSFRLLMSKHLEKEGKISMELVWEELINILLVNFNCIVKLGNLDLLIDGSPKYQISCALTACSFWSNSENTRYFYSKLEKEKTKNGSEQESPSVIEEDHQTTNHSLLDFKQDMEKNENFNGIVKRSIDKTKLEKDKDGNSELTSSPISPQVDKETPFKSEELISVVVHDMRSPLMCILGNLELIDFELKGKPSYSLVEPLIKSSMSASALLENLVSDILDAARIAKGIFKMNPTKMNLEETLKECVSTVSLAAKSRKIDIHLDYEGHQKIITSDKHRIKQVILNFLSNSIKFTQNGNIWIKVHELSKTIELSVKDDGAGISPEFLPHIFAKYRTDNQNKKNTQGIGLGLFICKSIIHKLGPKKDIKVESKLGDGTSFTFEIYKDTEKTTSPRETVAHEQSHLRKYSYGTIGCANYKANSTKDIAMMNTYNKAKSNMTIFAFNNQSAMESRRLIQTKMKWDISWVTKFKEQIPQEVSPETSLSIKKTSSGYPTTSILAFKKITSTENSNANNSKTDFSGSQMNMQDSDAQMRLSMPLVKATLDELSAEDESMEVDMTVLIVDDEPFILELLSDFFIIASEDLGIGVVEDSATDVHTTAEKMGKRDYDLVIIDFYLPDGTGPNFVKSFVEKQKLEGGKIPLFALSTGAERHEVEAETDSSLFFRILTKPITLAKFKELLQAVKDFKKANSK